MRETNGSVDSCNSCKRLVSSRLHEIHELTFPFVSLLNLSVLNFRIVLLMYPGSMVPSGRVPQAAAATDLEVACVCISDLELISSIDRGGSRGSRGKDHATMVLPLDSRKGPFLSSGCLLWASKQHISAMRI